MGDLLLNALEGRDKFTLNYVNETNLEIVRRGTNTEPPFSKLIAWNPQQRAREPKRFDVKVDINDAIIAGTF